MPLHRFDQTIDFYDSKGTLESQYVKSVYHSVLIFVGEDVLPTRELQISFVVATLLLGALLNANIFGNIALIILEL